MTTNSVSKEQIEAMARAVFPDAWRPRPEGAGKFFEANLQRDQDLAKAKVSEGFAAIATLRTSSGGVTSGEVVRWETRHKNANDGRWVVDDAASSEEYCMSFAGTGWEYRALVPLSQFQAVERELAQMTEQRNMTLNEMGREIERSDALTTRALTAEASLAAAREALSPFAGYAVTSINHENGQWVVRIPDNAPQPTFAHFDTARAALGASKP